MCCTDSGKCVRATIEVEVTEGKCRDRITSRSSELYNGTLGRANKHIDIVFLERLVESSVLSNRLGMLQKKAVSVRIILKGRCVF